jgi:hypothetical protein
LDFGGGGGGGWCVGRGAFFTDRDINHIVSGELGLG